MRRVRGVRGRTAVWWEWSTDTAARRLVCRPALPACAEPAQHLISVSAAVVSRGRRLAPPPRQAPFSPGLRPHRRSACMPAPGRPLRVSDLAGRGSGQGEVSSLLEDGAVRLPLRTHANGHHLTTTEQRAERCARWCGGWMVRSRGGGPSAEAVGVCRFGPAGAGDVHDAVEDGDVPAAPVQVGVVTAAQQRLSHESRVGWVGLGWCEILGCGCERALWRCGSVDVDAAVGAGMAA